ncbi:response regulator [Desulfohalovibrio reitneri]|uniref:response regulator n=1 Tax=Desulfohalovibrio reitneri TaxID=1307759 RepID=UPI0004A7328B|nr:response regulator [Desulfohalovibrio reitneri]
MNRRSINILIADDDDEDVLLVRTSFSRAGLINPLHHVRDGEELLAYLRGEDGFVDRTVHPYPGVVLLDLNMPRMDGREALEEIKSDPELCKLPVIVLTTSKSDEDILQSYRLGVNSFIRKPVEFSEFVTKMRVLGAYWLDIVELPEEAR